MGLLGPVVLYAKLLMQDLWRSGTHWDESVTQNIYTAWLEFTQQLESMNQVAFDRKILITECCDMQLHGFCDASNSGYGACIYIRSVGKSKTIISKLLCAKSRVAPLKPTTIPRLELCGAVLLAQLYQEVSGALNKTPDKITFWCDSTIVLSWLKTSPHLLKTYVANRVVTIRDITGSCEWRYIQSEENPADAISRGQLPHTFLHNKTWRARPVWLIRDEQDWPNDNIKNKEIPELKENTCLTVTCGDIGILERYSSYTKLCRIIAYCLRFGRTHKNVGSLNAQEIDETEKRVLKILQTLRFPEEIKGFKDTHSTYKGKLANLNPFLDEAGLIRVGGRLQMSNLTFAQKHPILLPTRHHITDQIIREHHERYFHAGIQSTLYIIRRKFWLTDGRNQVRKVIRTCTRYLRFNASSVKYKMGNLPSARVREAMPFANTGIDFCGPFYIKEKKYRNRTRVKVYVCVFICMTVKAVHLEVVSDLTTDGFLAALRRFIARRGIPENIYSDNGTNFTGAHNQLKELYALFNSDKHRETISKYAIEYRITWHFIPPVAPHFGGLWESTVKLFKHHFKRVVGDALFTFEELNTFTVEIEGILNSRPITSLSSDPNDILALTPAHCLIGKPLISLPEGNLTSVPVNRLSNWQHITKVRQDFWNRWHLEYLNELQKRTKWIENGPKVKEGTVVLIKDKNLPCTQWMLGKIVKLHPGKDGTTRTATIKTTNGELKRTMQCICPLPIDQ